MFASEFVAKITEAGFSYEKVTEEDLKHQPDGRKLIEPGIKVKVGSSIYFYSLEMINDQSRDHVDALIRKHKLKFQQEEDFANLPEKG